MKVKIYGAGSIGTHLAQAARRMGWSVCVVDPDPAALKRMREETYPSRYGAWDKSIKQYTLADESHGEFDGIFIGTPPNVRIKIAREALKEKPKFMLLEKPLCEPACVGLNDFVREVKRSQTAVFVGYNHSIAPSAEFVRGLLAEEVFGKILTLDVETRAHWRDIFLAHPWIKSPADTYLGHRSKGGGASGEHSHALHLALVLAQAGGLGSVSQALPMAHMVKDGNAHYDDITLYSLRFHNGVIGRVVQDVITRPTRKWARVQGENGYVEWFSATGPHGEDVVRWEVRGKVEEKLFPRTRPDDFFFELQHINECLEEENAAQSPISLARGVEVMQILRS